MGNGHWQLEGNTAELYQRYLVPAITTKWAEDLVNRARPRADETVLDVACGTGVVARRAAQTGAKVTGLDLNSGMLAVARRVPNEGGLVEWVEGSALHLPFPAARFDVVFCQLGLQFFPDQGRALREMCRVLKPSGRAALSVYGPIERTPGAHAFAVALDEVLGADASRIKRGEHSFTSPSELKTLLKNADFRTIEVRTVVQTIGFPSVLDYVRFQLLATPMSALLAGRAEPQRQTIISSVASRATALSTAEMLDGGGFTFPQEAYVAFASSAG
jgi:ubiquinone/menaquinone biosynthesis C-methylase UbiE